MHLAGFIWTLFFWEYAVFFVKPSEASFDVFKKDEFDCLIYQGRKPTGSAYLFSSRLALTEDFVFPQHQILQEAQLKISKISTLEHPHLEKKIDEIIIYSMFEPFGGEVGLAEFDTYRKFFHLNEGQNIVEVKVSFPPVLGVPSSPSTVTDDERNELALHFDGMHSLPHYVDAVLAELGADKSTTRLIILHSTVADRTLALATAILLKNGGNNLATQWKLYSESERDPKNFYWNLAQWYCYSLKVRHGRRELVCDDPVDIINYPDIDSVDMISDTNTGSVDVPENMEPSEASFDVFREDKFYLLDYHEPPDSGSAYLFSSLLAIDKNGLFPQDRILEAAQSEISKLSPPHLEKKIDEIIIYSMFDPFGGEVGLAEFDTYRKFFNLYGGQNKVKVEVFFPPLLGIPSSPSTETIDRRYQLALYFKRMHSLPNIVTHVQTELDAVKPTTRLIILHSTVAERTITLATAILLKKGKNNLAAQWKLYSEGERNPTSFYWNLAQWYCYSLEDWTLRPQLVCDDPVDMISDTNTDLVDVPNKRRLSGSDLQELEPIKLGD